MELGVPGVVLAAAVALLALTVEGGTGFRVWGSGFGEFS